MDIISDKVTSVLKMKNLYFEKISFDRDERVPNEFKTKFVPEYKDLYDNTIEVRLSCYIKSDVKFAMEVVLVGVFENTETDEKLRNEINKLNTISIMFPYLRAQLSLITSQPNFPAINFPVININALIEENGEMIAKKQ